MTMTIDEAISHAKEMSKQDTICEECQKEHTQLAIWLEELKILRTTMKHGKWQVLDNCSNEGVYCSVCQKKVYRKSYANQKVKLNFCPNCGAKMDLEEGK